MDLYLMLKSKGISIRSESSNFHRIVSFLKNEDDQHKYIINTDTVDQVSDMSVYFSKHYTF